MRKVESYMGIIEFLCEDCVGKKFGHSFCWRHWAERADACSSGNNASLPILGLCLSLRPEWKHDFNFLNGLLLAARTQLLR